MEVGFDPSHLEPGIGLQGLPFGSTQDFVEKQVGEPPEASLMDYPDDSDEETWEYPDLGLELTFGSAFDYRLDTIRVERKDMQLFGESVSGTKREDLVRLLAAQGVAPESEESYTTEDGRKISVLDYESLSLLLWLDPKRRLECIQIGLLWSDDDSPIFPGE